MPDLFNCVINHIMTHISQQTTEVWLGSYYMMDLEYADNTTLFSNPVIDLEARCNVFQEEAFQLHLQVSWEKTKLMHVCDGPDPPPTTAGTIAVEFLNSLNYLGSTVMNSGDLNEEINWCRNLATVIMQSLWKPLWRHTCIKPAHKTTYL